MEIKLILITALIITTGLFLMILYTGGLMDDERQTFINQETQKTYNSLNEMQVFLLMSEIYGDDMACIAFENKLRRLDDTVWNLGLKLDQYRVASEEFVKDPFYKEQKAVFNENEVFYMMLLQKLKLTCGYNQTIIMYFYTNGEDCAKCDDQSFVLTDINKDYDEELSIFSYDVELNITTVGLLVQYYNVSEYPCIVIENRTHCGMQDKEFVLNEICASTGNRSGACNP
jgi:hypothetical protein